jgi:hypothetical protein
MMKAKFFGLCLVVAGLFFTKATCGDDLLISGESASNGLNVMVSAPSGFTSRVEIYTCSNLVSGTWRVAAENLRPADGSPVKWYTAAGKTGFFIAGNMDVDSDGDGINDARELFVHKTNPDNSDSDGDLISDFQEFYINFTNPNNNDASPPSVWISAPGTDGRKIVTP